MRTSSRDERERSGSPFTNWRFTFFQGILFAVFALFTARMVEFMLLDSASWQAAADENRLNALPVAAPRGTIRDRLDMPLAVNAPAFNVRITPAALPLDEEAAVSIFNRLSALTGVPPTAVIARQSGQPVRSIEELVDEGAGIAPFRPVVIAYDVPQRVAQQILEEQFTLPGVDVDVASVRQYPTGELTAQIVGYMGRIPAERELELIEQGYDPAFDRIGYAGLEAYLEDTLAGVPGRIVREVDVAGEQVGDPIVSIAPQPGLSVRLTLDTELQQAAQDALTKRIDLLNADAGRIVSQTGVVVAMNPKTGEVLAMVSYPSYDNSRFARAIDVDYYLDIAADPLRPLVNHVTQSLYPPGSIWKMITAAGVLQENVIDPRSFLNDPGDLLLPNRYAPNDTAAAQRFVCWNRNGHGNLDLIGAIAQSCDVYFYQVGGGNPEVSTSVLREGGLGITDLFRYATAFGIGSKLGIELPFENASRMPDSDWKRRNYGENWSTGDTYNAAFGQGYVNVTPLQLLNSVAAIANGGTLVQPRMLRDTLDSEGGLVSDFEPGVMRHINIDAVPTTEPIRLLYVEDMIMRGEDSLACRCEENSDFFNPSRCDPANYRAQVDIDPEQFVESWRDYSVYTPDDYSFTDNFCSALRFDANYRPPFMSSENMAILQQSMRFTVTNGTGAPANLPFVTVAGKTGTAEYCDEVARPLGLCRPGNWPSHAWFTAYAPYEDPEIVAIAFVYNGGEGSRNALPIVVETIESYFRLKNERGTIEIAPPTP
ncbi:MAG: penicillin-binding transpeptidase domain-containing protein [Chloroflexota bacterium]|nr:penicillin-binding transpeptidase domain-containing protein [Chloroflexota bacterium]